MINHFLTQKSFKTVMGFTLIETLVSTFIITVVILGPLSLAINASTHARMTKNNLIATYLGQEAIELLRHQQDSIYIRCIQGILSKCTPTGSESGQQAAWRMFKDRMRANSQGVSCFIEDNPAGCSYDFIDMTTDLDANPTKYASSQQSCSMLSLQTSTKLYVCSGLSRGMATNTSFTRSISITSIPTIGGSDQNYNDDLRVTATVTFRGPNGYVHTVKIVDFLHATS